MVTIRIYNVPIRYSSNITAAIYGGLWGSTQANG